MLNTYSVLLLGGVRGTTLLAFRVCEVSADVLVLLRCQDCLASCNSQNLATCLYNSSGTDALGYPDDAASFGGSHGSGNNKIRR